MQVNVVSVLVVAAMLMSAEGHISDSGSKAVRKTYSSFPSENNLRIYHDNSAQTESQWVAKNAWSTNIVNKTISRELINTELQDTQKFKRSTNLNDETEGSGETGINGLLPPNPEIESDEYINYYGEYDNSLEYYHDADKILVEKDDRAEDYKCSKFEEDRIGK